MNASDLRQSFLDYFASKQHSIVPSASLMPSSPNLLFTNAGMNQFVPYFLAEREAPYSRATDTQKCIRAGGKHNDLEDVGFDTYHHTFFEMLGNWSFGDYFKTEAIDFAWELLTKVWGFPKERLYATIYKPGNGDPADFDQDAYDHWEKIFKAEGLDPSVHIRYGNKKDNFWMMGETGPCGPCSELHIDLTAAGDTAGKLVNADSPWCIEIWNLVFIQFNANEDGSFSPLPAKHIDTGMGFERVAGILATTKGFTDFSNPPSNYNSDLFTEIFEHLSQHCNHRYAYTMPENRDQMSAVEQKDCAFRVIADHIRTLSFSIADGILPGNEGRNYVLRRILRRAVMFGKRLELPAGFFAKMVPVIVEKMGDTFPELRKQQTIIHKVISSEETAFDKTIDRGLQLFDKLAADGAVSGEEAFSLYDTYGFPLDLTELLARERGVQVDTAGFDAAMERQRQRGRDSQKKEIIKVQSDDGAKKTDFLGFDLENAEIESAVLSATPTENGKQLVVLDRSPFYGEMGGQVGDSGTLTFGEKSFPIHNTQIQNGVLYHEVETTETIQGRATLCLDLPRRRAIQRHHSATHIINWALRSVLGDHIRQAGSLVTPDRLRFDFAHFEAVSPAQLEQIEKMANDAVLENAAVQWYEIPFDEKPDDVVAVFGEKYGATVRVVDIGGFSKELCGGTHVRSTGEIGLIKLTSESGIAAGTRRIEAVCGAAAYQLAASNFDSLQSLAYKLQCKSGDLDEKLESILVQRKELEKEIKRLQQKASAGQADALLAKATELSDGLRVLIQKVDAPNPDELKNLATALGQKLGESIVVLGAELDDKLTVTAVVSPTAIQAGHKAGDLIRKLTEKLGGKGGGKPNFAMGGAPNNGQLGDVMAEFSV